MRYYALRLIRGYGDGEPQSPNLKNLITALTKNSEEFSQRGVILTGVRGCRKQALIEEVSEKGFSSLLVVPSYHRNVHQFIDSSSVYGGPEIGDYDCMCPPIWFQFLWFSV